MTELFALTFSGADTTKVVDRVQRACVASCSYGQTAVNGVCAPSGPYTGAVLRYQSGRLNLDNVGGISTASTSGLIFKTECGSQLDGLYPEREHLRETSWTRRRQAEPPTGRCLWDMCGRVDVPDSGPLPCFDAEGLCGQL